VLLDPITIEMNTRPSAEMYYAGTWCERSSFFDFIDPSRLEPVSIDKDSKLPA